MNDFEELARRSADAARTSVDGVDVPELTGRARTGRVVVAAIGVGALALLGGLALAWPDDDSSPAEVAGGDDTEASSAPPIHLVWPDPPDGIEFVSATELRDVDGEVPESQGLLFGAGTEEDPFADGDLMVITYAIDRPLELDGDPITVRGKPGAVVPSGMRPGNTHAIQWQESATVSVTLSSNSFDTSELVSLADSLVFDGHRTSLTDSDELELLVDNDRLAYGLYSAGPEMSIVYYDTPDDEPGGAVIRSAPGDEAALLAARYAAGCGTPITVRGGEGWLICGTKDAGFGYGSKGVFWLADGVLFTVSVSDDLDPVAVAEQLVEIDDAAWQRLVEESEAKRREVEGERELVAEGTFATEADDYSWRLALDEHGLCLALDSDGSGSTSCAPLTPETISFTSTVAAESADLVLEAYGVVADEVDRLVIEGHEDVDLPIYELTTEPRRVFGVVRPTTTDAVELVAYAADGTELWRRQPDTASATDLGEVDPAPRIELMAKTQETPPDSIALSLYVQGDSLCLDVTFETAGTGTCTSGEIVSDSVGGLFAIGGFVDGCVDAVTVTSPGVPTTRDDAGPEGFAFYTMIFDTDPAVEITFFDAEGTEVGTGDVLTGTADISC